jgi:hypothetical protein
MSSFSRALPAETAVSARFAIEAAADPGVMPRVLELFAKRGLVPALWTSRVGPADRLTIDIEMHAMSAELAFYIGECLRQIVGVETAFHVVTTSMAARA